VKTILTLQPPDRVSQSRQQGDAVGLVQRDGNHPRMVVVQPRNRVKKVAIRRDEDGAQFLSLGEKIIVRGASRKMFQGPAALVSRRSKFIYRRPRKIFIETGTRVPVTTGLPWQIRGSIEMRSETVVFIAEN
jgi:hypothetical protein